MLKIINRIVKIGAYRYWCIALLSLLIVWGGHFILTARSDLKEQPIFSLNRSVTTEDSQKLALSGEAESEERMTSSSFSKWHPVTIGGGGYVTGLYLHPNESDLMYVRTDNGGFYRWQTTQQQWLPITNSLPRSEWDYDHNSGGEAIALDPQNPDVVYIAVGKYTDRPGTIYKSLDRGTTWQTSDLSVPMGGDQDKRWAGNRLVVSPLAPNVLLFGSRRDGLWRSQDGGKSWTQVSVPVAENEIGVLAIAFDPKQENLVYASVYDRGVYRSKDRGITWQKITNSPREVMQMAVASDGVLYATNNESPQVSKYANHQWVEITPGGFVHSTFNGLSLHPLDAETLIVSEGEKGRAKIFYSDNSGASWNQKQSTLNKTIPWLAKEFFNDHPSTIAFDPQKPQRVWLTDWFSVWRTDNIALSPVTWTNQVKGIEQTVLFTLVSPPEGAVLISGLADQDGFYHHDLNDFPQSRLGFQHQGFNFSSSNLGGDRYLDNYFQDTFDLAYCQTQPQHLVRVGGQRWRNTYIGVNSDDGGLTWQPWANIPDDTLFMRVAISPSDPQHFVVTTSEDQPLLTRDGGKTWTEVAGLPDGETGPWNWNKPLAADGAQDDYFYYYGKGKVYRSSDGGSSFQQSEGDFPQDTRHVLTTVPGVAGEIWLSLDEGGLYHSQDGAITFDKIDFIEQAHLVTVGTPIAPELPHSIYVYGTLKNGKSGLFVSVDSGLSWQQIDRKAEIPRSTKILTASQQQPGLLFAGTDGRGIHYRLIEASQIDLSQ